MIQAIGLTSDPRKELPPAVDDVSFEARAGRVTALLGASGAGKTTALRLMLELQRGRGITYFRGRPLHRIAHPSREVGVLLGDLPGHPSRTVRGHLRMLCAAAGVPARRADEVLEVVGLVSLREERLGTLSRGMDRRLGLACALLADPHTLVLDDPAGGLSARESRWLYGMLHAHATQGGTVLLTTADPKQAARTADRVVTLQRGRLIADQEAADFARTRLRPRVAVRTPHASRLAALLTKEARTAHRSVEVVRESGNRLSVYGSTCADVGEIAFRHGILVHQLADEIGDMGPGTEAGPRTPEPRTYEVQQKPAAPLAATGGRRRKATPPPVPDPGLTGTDDPAAEREAPQASGREPAAAAAAQEACAEVLQASAEVPQARAGGPRPADAPTGGSRATAAGSRSSSSSVVALPDLPPPISVRPAPSPLRPLRYELRRAVGVGTSFATGAAVLVVSALTAVLLARVGHTPQHRLMAAWPQQLPLPPAALGAGLLGAIAFGDEFRHPALAADRGTVPRRLGLLAAKLLVASATALVLAVLTVGCDTEVLYLVYGRELAEVPAEWLSLSASWIGLMVGCAWAGVLAAGLFRSTTAGLAAVVSVPVVVVPLVQKAMDGPSVRTAAGFPLRLREVLLSQWPFGGERYLEAAARVVAQPVGGALTLSLTALLCAYVLTTLRSRVR
ncbi:ABC transporter [Streptomyces viridochromogenes]|uniref:ABC transporter n=1 Tax=Streptomyces viridochromogenes TaxID=1938 RepID=A0A0J7ZJ62_STRVR|nr:ABC transporter ATP-binding protein [Streptomyces viridochromogenes]KMS76041.1 ABC transporter [Streptomyces viridochromogenes]KOG07620.1 ABC transporter [Streptomyces viridochromogenes]KOG12761.1 ABC transporter [Streptomyces viridochromogenes]